MNTSAYIFSCDWGTSSFRIRLVDAQGQRVLWENKTGEGILSTLNTWLATGNAVSRRQFYGDMLRQSISECPEKLNYQPVVILSGMASGSYGMLELPYLDLPVGLNTTALLIQPVLPDQFFDHEIWLVSGLRNKLEVMRGEESILAGCGIAEDASEILIFPGTHSKHVFVENGRIMDFNTYMTGEIFDLLLKHSILSRALEPGHDAAATQAFDNGCRSSRQGNLLNQLFHVRTRHLFGEIGSVANYHYLSGLLIGHELKDLASNKQSIRLVSCGALLNAYLRALNILYPGRTIAVSDADESLVKAHCAIYRNHGS